MDSSCIWDLCQIYRLRDHCFCLSWLALIKLLTKLSEVLSSNISNLLVSFSERWQHIEGLIILGETLTAANDPSSILDVEKHKDVSKLAFDSVCSRREKVAEFYFFVFLLFFFQSRLLFLEPFHSKYYFRISQCLNE